MDSRTPRDDGSDELIQAVAWEICPLIKPMLDADDVERHPCRRCVPRDTGYGIGTPMCLSAAEEVVRATIVAIRAALAEQTQASDPRGEAHPNHGAP